MEVRTLGKTGRRVSALGFGCGGVGGLMVNGELPEMIQAVGRAMEAGVTYFDTAQLYGDGRSEANLGRVLKKLQSSLPPDLTVGTKVRLQSDVLAQHDSPEAITGAIMAAAEVSLRRLQTDCLDLFQLHNPLGEAASPDRGHMAVADLPHAVAAFERLQTQGKIRHWGINGLGTTAAVQRALDMGSPATLQVCYNLLNPSAGQAMPAGYPFQDYDRLLEQTAAREMGVMAIRVLAAGALSGAATRHPVAAQSVSPIATNADFAGDVALAQRFRVLVDAGHVTSLVEAALRFALGRDEISTVLVGLSSMAQLEEALAAVAKGPLPDEALALLPDIWSSFEARA